MAIISGGISRGLDISAVFNSLSATMEAYDTKIRDQIAAGGSGENGTFSNTELITLQSDLNQWSLINSLESNIVKTISDTMKGTVQNIK